MSAPRSKGRSISGPENARREPPAAVPAPPSGPVPGPGSPFARYGPDANAMVASGEENRRQSLGVLAIVGGLVFAVVAAVVVGGVVILLWFAYRQSGIGGEVVAVDPTDARHVRDTGFAGPIERPAVEPGSGTRRGKGDPVRDPNVRDPSLGPPPGPATVIVPSTMMFLTAEISCPGGFRKRGTFRQDSPTTLRATVPDVPGDEKCTVTFQGSEPAKTWITGNETKTCTFNPVTCYLVH